MFVICMRNEFDKELHWPEGRMPCLMMNRDPFTSAFNSESARLLECASPDDYAWLEGELVQHTKRHAAVVESDVSMS
jgi:hypothetical protein